MPRVTRMVTLPLCAAGDESTSVWPWTPPAALETKEGRAISNLLPSGGPELQGNSFYVRERRFGSIFYSLYTYTFIKL